MKSKISALTAATAMAVAGLLGATGTASAAAAPNPNDVIIPLHWNEIGSGLTATVPFPGLAVGDCTLEGGSKVTLDFSSGSVTVNGVARTSHTNNADIFHSNFSFLDSSGRSILGAGGSGLDSPAMSIINADYGWTKSIPVSIPAAALNATSVMWVGHC